MKKILIISLTLLCFKPSQFTYVSNNPGVLPAIYQDSDPERLMKLFLEVIKSNSETEVKKFINENYADHFLKNIPLEIHLKVINDLHKDFARYALVKTTNSGDKSIAVIKSPVNKMKQITIQTDAKNPSKIFIIDVKNYE
jgi:hypothetical protein